MMFLLIISDRSDRIKTMISKLAIFIQIEIYSKKYSNTEILKFFKVKLLLRFC